MSSGLLLNEMATPPGCLVPPGASRCTVRHLIDAVCKIRRQKQCATVARIHKAVRQQLQRNVDVEEVLEQLRTAAEVGELWRVDNNGVTSYREPPKGSTKEHSRWPGEKQTKWPTKEQGRAQFGMGNMKYPSVEQFADPASEHLTQRAAEHMQWSMTEQLRCSTADPPREHSMESSRYGMNDPFMWPISEQMRWPAMNDPISWSAPEPHRQTGEPVVQQRSMEQVSWPMNDTFRRPMNEPLAWPMNQSLRRPMAEPLTWHMTEPLRHPMADPLAWSMTEPLRRPMTEPLAWHGNDQLRRSVKEPLAWSVAAGEPFRPPPVMEHIGWCAPDAVRQPPKEPYAKSANETSSRNMNNALRWPSNETQRSHSSAKTLSRPATNSVKEPCKEVLGPSFNCPVSHPMVNPLGPNDIRSFSQSTHLTNSEFQSRRLPGTGKGLQVSCKDLHNPCKDSHSTRKDLPRSDLQRLPDSTLCSSRQNPYLAAACPMDDVALMSNNLGFHGSHNSQVVHRGNMVTGESSCLGVGRMMSAQCVKEIIPQIPDVVSGSKFGSRPHEPLCLGAGEMPGKDGAGRNCKPSCCLEKCSANPLRLSDSSADQMPRELLKGVVQSSIEKSERGTSAITVESQVGGKMTSGISEDVQPKTVCDQTSLLMAKVPLFQKKMQDLPISPSLHHEHDLIPMMSSAVEGSTSVKFSADAPEESPSLPFSVEETPFCSGAIEQLPSLPFYSNPLKEQGTFSSQQETSFIGEARDKEPQSGVSGSVISGKKSATDMNTSTATKDCCDSAQPVSEFLLLGQNDSVSAKVESAEPEACHDHSSLPKEMLSDEEALVLTDLGTECGVRANSLLSHRKSRDSSRNRCVNDKKVHERRKCIRKSATSRKWQLNLTSLSSVMSAALRSMKQTSGLGKDGATVHIIKNCFVSAYTIAPSDLLLLGGHIRRALAKAVEAGFLMKKKLRYFPISKNIKKHHMIDGSAQDEKLEDGSEKQCLSVVDLPTSSVEGSFIAADDDGHVGSNSGTVTSSNSCSSTEIGKQPAVAYNSRRSPSRPSLSPVQPTGNNEEMQRQSPVPVDSSTMEKDGFEVGDGCYWHFLQERTVSFNYECSSLEAMSPNPEPSIVQPDENSQSYENLGPESHRALRVHTGLNPKGLIDGLTKFFTPSNKRCSRVSSNMLQRTTELKTKSASSSPKRRPLSQTSRQVKVIKTASAKAKMSTSSRSRSPRHHNSASAGRRKEQLYDGLSHFFAVEGKRRKCTLGRSAGDDESSSVHPNKDAKTEFSSLSTDVKPLRLGLLNSHAQCSRARSLSLSGTRDAKECSVVMVDLSKTLPSRDSSEPKSTRGELNSRSRDFASCRKRPRTVSTSELLSRQTPRAAGGSFVKADCTRFQLHCSSEAKSVPQMPLSSQEAYHSADSSSENTGSVTEHSTLSTDSSGSFPKTMSLSKTVDISSQSWTKTSDRKLHTVVLETSDSESQVTSSSSSSCCSVSSMFSSSSSQMTVAHASKHAMVKLTRLSSADCSMLLSNSYCVSQSKEEISTETETRFALETAGQLENSYSMDQRLISDGGTDNDVQVSLTEDEPMVLDALDSRRVLRPSVTPNDIILFRKAQKIAAERILVSQELNRLDPCQPMPPCIQFGPYEICTLRSSLYPPEFASLPKLFICEFCLKCLKNQGALQSHLTKCRQTFPPGSEIYRHDNLSVFEVDGNSSPVYCQNVCLLARLFVSSKSPLQSNMAAFLFYILTLNDDTGCHLIGYFAKEKYSSHSCSLVTLLVLPQHRHKGYGDFLIQFSYLICRLNKSPGSPQKPLSPVASSAFCSNWSKTVAEYVTAHRGTTDQPLTIRDISFRTGIHSSDVTTALFALNLIIGAKPEIGATLTLDNEALKNCVSLWVEPYADRRIRLDLKSLQWTKSSVQHLLKTSIELQNTLQVVTRKSTRKIQRKRIDDGLLCSVGLAKRDTKTSMELEKCFKERHFTGFPTGYRSSHGTFWRCCDSSSAAAGAWARATKRKSPSSVSASPSKNARISSPDFNLGSATGAGRLIPSGDRNRTSQDPQNPPLPLTTLTAEPQKENSLCHENMVNSEISDKKQECSETDIFQTENNLNLENARSALLPVHKESSDTLIDNKCQDGELADNNKQEEVGKAGGIVEKKMTRSVEVQTDAYESDYSDEDDESSSVSSTCDSSCSRSSTTSSDESETEEESMKSPTSRAPPSSKLLASSQEAVVVSNSPGLQDEAACCGDRESAVDSVVSEEDQAGISSSKFVSENTPPSQGETSSSQLPYQYCGTNDSQASQSLTSASGFKSDTDSTDGKKYLKTDEDSDKLYGKQLFRSSETATGSDGEKAMMCKPNLKSHPADGASTRANIAPENSNEHLLCSIDSSEFANDPYSSLPGEENFQFGSVLPGVPNNLAIESPMSMNSSTEMAGSSTDRAPSQGYSDCPQAQNMYSMEGVVSSSSCGYNDHLTSPVGSSQITSPVSNQSFNVTGCSPAAGNSTMYSNSMDSSGVCRKTTGGQIPAATGSTFKMPVEDSRFVTTSVAGYPANGFGMALPSPASAQCGYTSQYADQSPGTQCGAIVGQNSPNGLSYNMPTPSPTNSSSRSFNMTSPNTNVYQSHPVSQTYDRSCPSAPVLSYTRVLPQQLPGTPDGMPWAHIYPPQAAGYSLIKFQEQDLLPQHAVSLPRNLAPLSTGVIPAQQTVAVQQHLTQVNLVPLSKPTKSVSGSQANSKQHKRCGKSCKGSGSSNVAAVMRSQTVAPNVTIQPGTNMITSYNVLNMNVDYRTAAHQPITAYPNGSYITNTAFIGEAQQSLNIYQHQTINFPRQPQPHNSMYAATYGYINGAIAQQSFNINVNSIMRQ